MRKANYRSRLSTTICGSHKFHHSLKSVHQNCYKRISFFPVYFPVSKGKCFNLFHGGFRYHNPHWSKKALQVGFFLVIDWPAKIKKKSLFTHRCKKGARFPARLLLQSPSSQITSIALEQFAVTKRVPATNTFVTVLKRLLGSTVAAKAARFASAKIFLVNP